MNKFLSMFLKIGLTVAETLVPAIATVEESITALTKPGADKKTEAMSIVMNSPAILEAVLNKDIIDNDLFKAGISEINDGYVKVMKAINKNDSSQK